MTHRYASKSVIKVSSLSHFVKVSCDQRIQDGLKVLTKPDAAADAVAR